MNKSNISLKGSMEPESLAKLLEDIAVSIKAGTVCLQKGGEFVTLKPAGNMEFEIEAAIKKGKQKLEIAVKWEEAREIAAPGDIKVSSEEPELPCPVEGEDAAEEPLALGEDAEGCGAGDAPCLDVPGVETKDKKKKKGKGQPDEVPADSPAASV